MYYLLWKTRNGQQQWDGPFATEEQATNRAAMTQPAQETGDWFVTKFPY